MQGIAFGANPSKGCNNGAWFHTTSGLCGINRQLGQSDSVSQALSFRMSKKSGRQPNLMRLNVGIRIVAAGKSDRNMTKAPGQGNEKTTSRRLQVVSNAAPMTVRSATGMLIPLSIVDSDPEDPEEDKFENANDFNQLLIQKKKVAAKKRRADRSLESEGEVAVTAKGLNISEKPKDSESSLSSSSVANYVCTLRDLIDQLEGIRLHALALERWHAPQLKKVHRYPPCSCLWSLSHLSLDPFVVVAEH